MQRKIPLRKKKEEEANKAETNALIEPDVINEISLKKKKKK